MADLQTHVDTAVRKALAAADGDPTRAQRLLARWAATDPRLMAGLSKPFLAGITAHAVQRVSGKKIPSAATPDTPGAGTKRSRRPTQLTPEDFEAVVGRLGQAIGTSRAPEGMSALIRAPQPTRAGTGHEKTLRALAVTYARQRLERRADELDRVNRTGKSAD